MPKRLTVKVRIFSHSLRGISRAAKDHRCLATCDDVSRIHRLVPFAALPKIVWGLAALVMDFTFEILAGLAGFAIGLSFHVLIRG
jgi:hypothetical protein